MPSGTCTCEDPLVSGEAPITSTRPSPTHVRLDLQWGLTMELHLVLENDLAGGTESARQAIATKVHEEVGT